MKRGHSNVDAKKTVGWHTVEKWVESGIARIPLSGGASALTSRELPPLSLREEEWKEIGRRMGWLENESRVFIVSPVSPDDELHHVCTTTAADLLSDIYDRDAYTIEDSFDNMEDARKAAFKLGCLNPEVI